MMPLVVPKYAQKWPSLGDSPLHLHCRYAIRRKYYFQFTESKVCARGMESTFMEHQVRARHTMFKNIGYVVTQTLDSGLSSVSYKQYDLRHMT